MGAMQGRLETPPVLLLPGSVVLPVPEMQDRHSETPILDAHAMAQQAHGEIRILVAPTGEGFVHAVEGVKIMSPYANVAGAIDLPLLCIAVPQSTQRQAQPPHRLVHIAPPPAFQPRQRRPANRGD